MSRSAHARGGGIREGLRVPRQGLIEDTALRIRATAAWEASHTVPGEERLLLLSYVVWPREPMRTYTNELARERLLRFNGQGTWTKVA